MPATSPSHRLLRIGWGLTWRLLLAAGATLALGSTGTWLVNRWPGLPAPASLGEAIERMLQLYVYGLFYLAGFGFAAVALAAGGLLAGRWQTSLRAGGLLVYLGGLGYMALYTDVAGFPVTWVWLLAGLLGLLLPLGLERRAARQSALARSMN